jgi:hypothetical protein
MSVNQVISLNKRDEQKPFFERLLHQGARKLLQPPIENEIFACIQFHKDRRDENGQPPVVRSGHLPEREIISGIGPIKVRATDAVSLTAGLEADYKPWRRRDLSQKRYVYRWTDGVYFNV